ncbi:MAG: TrbG/VirB9 family P-type conjugative transfer protein [Pseudomonadota bacterium]
MKKLVLIVLLFFVANAQVNASQLPRYLGKEKKFRMFIYNPYDVYRYVGNYNYHGFIEFQGNAIKQSAPSNNGTLTDASVPVATAAEEITEVAIGNSDAWLWKISDSKNRLYLKPVGDNANTNMTVKTSLGRVYNFELIARTPTGPDDENLIFAVKFVYPDDTDKNILEFPKTQPSDEPDMRNLSIYNFNYEYTGEPRIAPLKVFDNGEFTYFQFARKSAELPAIFAVDSEGFESLLNFRIAGDYVVAERVGSQFTLRNGSEIVCVYNNNLFKSGKIISNAKVNSGNPMMPNYNGAPPSSPMSPNKPN